MSLAVKNNGCHECCKRRVKCDKTEPRCLKCIKKGITCSGQGLRCRFSSQMKLVSKTSTSPKALIDKNALAGHETQLQWIDEARELRQRRRRSDKLVCAQAPKTTDEQSPQLLQLVLGDVNPPQVRLLFQHFSDRVAPIMVALDTEQNGYRNIVLPLAYQNEGLRRAVCVVAMFHMAQKTPHMREAAEAGQQRIIEDLRRDSLRNAPDRLFSNVTLATVIMLLVSETITGTDNYGFLLEMLVSMTQSPELMSGLSPSETHFFWQQIRMFQLFGTPLSNESKGVEILNGPLDAYLDWVTYPDLEPGSENQRNMTLIRGAIQDACAIYRRRATSAVSREESNHIVEQLRLKLEGLTTAVDGIHSLVWPYFIAAAESDLPEHRQFFSERLASLYECTGLGCIPAAVRALETVWSIRNAGNWTTTVITRTPILVM